MLVTNTAPDVALSGNHPVPTGGQHTYISKAALDSLLSATFKETGKIDITNEPIIMTVEDLEEMAEGFANAFKEEDKIKITASIDKVFAT